MKNLMATLETLGFTKQTGLSGLSNGDVAVSMHWSGEEAMVYVDSKMVLSSSNEDEIVNAVKSELAKKASSKTTDNYEAEMLAIEVSKDSEMKYYKEEDNRGKLELIKNALSSIKAELPKTIKFGDFQKLVESHIN